MGDGGCRGLAAGVSTGRVQAHLQLLHLGLQALDDLVLHSRDSTGPSGSCCCCSGGEGSGNSGTCDSTVLLQGDLK